MTTLNNRFAIHCVATTYVRLRQTPQEHDRQDENRAPWRPRVAVQ